MASRAMYLPLLARLPQDRVTQRLCAAWFAQFPLDTLLRLREAPPEVFDFLIGQVVRIELRQRRSHMRVVQLVALLMAAVTALDINSGAWYAVPFTSIGWWSVANSVRSLTPERCIPPFVFRIRGWHVTGEQHT